MIHLVVALFCEAKPLIARYALKACPYPRPFRIYGNDEIGLVISGVGKALSAAATTYLYCVSGEQRDQPWINIGVGGHRDCDIGTMAIAHKIRDAGSGNSWYPPLLTESPCRTMEVVTVDRCEEEYRQTAIYEMEAAGFYSTANRFSTAELVHCCKIVSDNSHSPPQTVTASGIAQLIAENIALFDQFLAHLSQLRSEIEFKEHPDWQSFHDRWHFTATQCQRLRRLLQCWSSLLPHQSPWCKELEKRSNAREVLQFLQDYLESVPIDY